MINFEFGSKFSRLVVLSVSCLAGLAFASLALAFVPPFRAAPTTFVDESSYCKGGKESVQSAVRIKSEASYPDSSFVEEFTGNKGLERFRRGVYHRNIGAQETGHAVRVSGDNNSNHGGSWTGDHDLNCGPPQTQRPLASSMRPTGPERKWLPEVDFALDRIFYLCSDHLMTSMGDVDGYSLAWFSPKQQFSRSSTKKVSWEVNITHLGGRKWWEVSIIPLGAPFLTSASWMAPTAAIDHYDPRSIIVGMGPFGGTVNVTTNSINRLKGSTPLCNLDPAGCASKVIRRSFAVTDNDDGTLTVEFAGFKKKIPGRFPDDFEVSFQDHSYTPNKDIKPAGYTWHWDNIRVQ